LAAEQETTLNALAVEAFNDLLKKHGKRASFRAINSPFGEVLKSIRENEQRAISLG
jgi:hypothetical protein